MNKEQRTTPLAFYIITGCIFLLVIILPYTLSFQYMGDRHQFTGLLVNPLDGLSYFAKIYQSADGAWQFRLPFTAENQEGAYLFLFYTLLGKVTSITGFSVATTYHLSRVINSILLVITLGVYSERLFKSNIGKKFSFMFLLFGSGLGWVLSSGAVLPPDFWIAEAYPFLSAYSNPHFPLTLALMLWLMLPGVSEDHEDNRNPWFIVIISILLSIISPFGVVIVLMVNVSTLLVDQWRSHGLSISHIGDIVGRILKSESFLVFLGGLPYSIYVLAVTRMNEVFASWHAQNLTPAPPVLLFILGFSPGIIIALLSGIRSGAFSHRGHRTLFLWIIWGVLLTYLPFGLQRRMMLGLFIPITYLAISMVIMFTRDREMFRQIVLIVMFIIILPSNMLILFTANFANQSKDPSIYLTADEYNALIWLQENTNDNSLILTSPEGGRFVPAFTGRRVIYGHPFETANAEFEVDWVSRIFSIIDDEDRALEAISERGIDYVLFGPRETAITHDITIDYLEIIFENDTVSIYQVND